MTEFRNSTLNLTDILKTNSLTYFIPYFDILVPTTTKLCLGRRMFKMLETESINDVKHHLLTRRFPTVLYALAPACAELAHFGLREEIARD